MNKQKYNRIVIKIGTAVISDKNNLLNTKFIQRIVRQITKLKQQNIEIILISSGAVGAGKSLLKPTTKLNKISQRQIFAAVGQIELMKIYSELFAKDDHACAQVLATKEDFRDRQHYLNMKNCLQALLKNRIIPIVNENDVVAVDELMFTDNDELAGLIAGMLNADALIILTNVDGIFDGDPENKNSKIISEIRPKDNLPKYILPHCSSFSRGGMTAKYKTAKKLASLGIVTHIINGRTTDILKKILDNKLVGTKFVTRKKISNIKKWIASTDEIKGTIHINDCAVEALLSKTSSLLPVGITKIEGKFDKGDVVKICNGKNKILGHGKTQYDSDKASGFILQKNKPELIHCDYLYLK